MRQIVVDYARRRRRAKPGGGRELTLDESVFLPGGRDLDVVARDSALDELSRVAERWIESCRRDLLDHVITLNDQHLKRLLSDYVRYYHEDRTHLGLGKGTPNHRSRAMASGSILVTERLGGLHHRYDRAA